jgi:hypothetical protein
MTEPLDLARIGYGAYGDDTDWTNYAGHPMPSWQELPAPHKRAWVAAAEAIARAAVEPTIGQTPAEPTPVVLVRTTIMTGTVVTWYRTIEAAQTYRPTLSASRRGVAVEEDYLTGIPAGWVTAAAKVYGLLRRTPDLDVSHLATHRNSVTSNGPLVPVESAGREVDRA